MDLNSSEDEEGPTPAGPGPSTAAAAPITVIDLCDDDTPIVAHSPEADDAALARRLQAEEYGELPPEDWGQAYGAQPPSSSGGTSKRAHISELVSQFAPARGTTCTCTCTCILWIL